jgi:hypothetical protein
MIITPAAGAIKPTLSRTARPIVQNIGPGVLYFNTSGTDVINTGIKMDPMAVYEFPTTLVEGPGDIWFQADEDTCDVRILNVG